MLVRGVGGRGQARLSGAGTRCHREKVRGFGVAGHFSPGARIAPSFPPGGARPSESRARGAPDPARRPPPCRLLPCCLPPHPGPTFPLSPPPSTRRAQATESGALGFGLGGHLRAPLLSRPLTREGRRRPSMLGTSVERARPATQLGLQRKSGFGLAPLVSGRREGGRGGPPGALATEVQQETSDRHWTSQPLGPRARGLQTTSCCLGLADRKRSLLSFFLRLKAPTFVLAKCRRGVLGVLWGSRIRGVGVTGRAVGGLGRQKAGTAGSKLSPPVFSSVILRCGGGGWGGVGGG